MNYALSLSTPVGSTITAKRGVLPVISDPVLIDVAKRLYALRKIRDQILGDALFSEPAWDILLDLFISDHECRQLSVSAVCIGARAPSATALRYLTMLQEAGLVERTRDERDGRRSHVQLTTLGRRRMASLLARMTDE
ncbi:winged helix DNA-binding protein [Sphingomonas sp. 4RDLI-65]|uniref:winged helix DNA-binding protein n=1 Tax=Sphingomonas sp. 4RDLI-65 TaxID=3111641 RepID=UPI003C1F8634